MDFFWFRNKKYTQIYIMVKKKVNLNLTQYLNINLFIMIFFL